ncbi:hypothetical protein N9112_00395 [bacterium]|nr:hypothetical protein [bacterium]
MANRNTLHRNKLDAFIEWLQSEGHKLSPPIGAYEVLRWKGKSGEPMPIVFDRHGGDHLVLNGSAENYVKRWLRGDDSEDVEKLVVALRAAMHYINVSPCDPDITPEQIDAWLALVNLDVDKLLEKYNVGG